jgi:hypothetical protein
MQSFATPRDAKEFLISRIITESQCENIPLSDVERKMLYFSETAWTLPDIAEVSDAFDRDYDQAEYEKKIGALIRSLCAKARKNNRYEFEAWKEAEGVIRREDHYLLVLISASEGSPPKSWWQLLTYGAVAFLIASAILEIYLFVKR